LELVKTLNRLFIITSICLLVIAFVLGIAMSLRITNPLKRISKKASLLSEGNYKQRLDDDSNMSEISILTQTINNLSDALERKEQVRKQLTQDVAHELRTPITSVQGHMEAMIDGIWPMNKERLSSCYEEIIRIKRLIGTIDDINGLENETILIHKAEFDLSRLINRILSNYEKEILTKSIKLSYQAQKIIMNADEDKISQVFHNLISNAIKYSNDGDELTIETVDRPKQVEIKVIGGTSAIGICGSGLLDIAGELVRVGIIGKNGKLASPKTVTIGALLEQYLIEKEGKVCFEVAKGVYLTQKDIRQIQLAKGAIRAGIEALLRHMEIRIDEVVTVLIAGSFGYHLRESSLINIGLLPKEFAGKIKFIGNTSKSGGKALLLNTDLREKAANIVKEVVVVELSKSEGFEKLFVDAMSF
jgi:HAMP domain-containing protein